MARTTSSSRDALKLRLGQAGSIALHWLDNFIRTFARQGISLDREMFVSMLWTAHGVKIWPGPRAVTMPYTYEGDQPVGAMPRLSFLLSDDVINQPDGKLRAVSIHLHPESLSERRHVRRVPIKPIAVTPEEDHYMSQSLDGLGCFEPVDIYNVNIQAYDGLLRSIQHCQSIEGF